MHAQRLTLGILTALVALFVPSATYAAEPQPSFGCQKVAPAGTDELTVAAHVDGDEWWFDLTITRDEPPDYDNVIQPAKLLRGEGGIVYSRIWEGTAGPDFSWEKKFDTVAKMDTQFVRSYVGRYQYQFYWKRTLGDGQILQGHDWITPVLSYQVGQNGVL